MNRIIIAGQANRNGRLKDPSMTSRGVGRTEENKGEEGGGKAGRHLAIWSPMPLVAPVTTMETPSSGGSSSGLARWLAAMRWKRNSPTTAIQPRPHSSHPSASRFSLRGSAPSPPPDEVPAFPLPLPSAAEEEAEWSL